jgi:cyclophilin family peptidyl-prolyl cis-trans isomerase
MLKTLTRTLCALALYMVALPLLAANPRVLMETTLGNITLELYPDRAPATVTNFLRYVDEGFYSSTVFHRVIDGFMIQGGGLDKALHRKPTHDPIPNEADNGLTNERGTVAMARTSQPDSATSQFFINLVDNSFLDFREKSRRGWGYTVFGRVVAGMDTVDKIAKLPTTARPDGARDVPIEPPVIKRVTRIAAEGQKQ